MLLAGAPVRSILSRDGSDESGAAGVGDLGSAEAEHLELRQPSSRRRRRTCWQRRRHEGGEALVAERVATEMESLTLIGNPFGDEGLAALLAPPPPAGTPPLPTGGLKKLKELDLGHTQITDSGCAALAAALHSGALPALKKLRLDGIPASDAAKAAVYAARANLGAVSEDESEDQWEEVEVIEHM